MCVNLYRYFSGELTAEERLELLHSIENDSRLKAEFIRLQNLITASLLSSHPSDSIDGIVHYKAFVARAEQTFQRKFLANFVKYAAIVLLVVASTVWATVYFSDTAHKQSLNTLYVPAGQRARITLQDGTEVWLNAQSILKYPSRFTKKNRKVEIMGEAFFDVAHDEKRPFIVTAQNIDMVVLGTQFNVYSYPEAGYIQTGLIEGSVKIIDKSNEWNNVTLQPSEQATFKDGQIGINHIPNPDHMLWKEGIYCFHNERLIDIIEKLQLYYDIKIVVKDPEIFNVRYTGKFRQRDGIDEILHIIQKIQSFKIERDRDNNIITLTK